MTALVITHSASCGPGHVTTWLAEVGLSATVVQPWNGDELPASLDGFAALVVMGGPQSAYGEADWFPSTKELLRSAVAQGIPMFGICLGAQLLADACGGQVKPGEHGPEVGARLVAKRDVAGADPLFWDLPLSPLVVQWHWDAITELPPGSTLLMSATTYPHQAFRVGDRAWGIQFHVETPPEMVAGWAAADREDLSARGVDVDALLARTVAELDEVAEVWGEVLRRFARFALER